MIYKTLKLHFPNKLARIGLLLTGLMFFTVVGFSQEVPYTEEVTIIAPYQPSVDDANKINVEPQFEDPNIQPPEINYSINSFRIPTTYKPGSLKPASIVGEPISKLYRNYIKAGVGNYWTPYVELYAGSLRSKQHVFSVKFKHLSSNGSMKDTGPSQFSKNELGLYAKKIYKSHVLNGYLKYNRDVVHYYGFNPDDYAVEFDKDSLKQRYQTLSTGFVLQNSNAKNNDHSHYLGLNYTLWNSRFDATEHIVNLKTGLVQKVDAIKVLDSQEAGVDIDASYYNERLDDVENLGVINVFPYFKAILKEYSLRLGVGLHEVLDEDPIMYLSPLIDLSVTVIPDAMKIYVGVKGGVERHSMAGITTINPFALPGINSVLSTTSYNAFGGVKGKIGSNMDLNINIEAAQVDNMPFFVNSPLVTDGTMITNNGFSIITDDVSYYHLNTEFTYRFTETFLGRVYGDYYSYTLTALPEPFHKPELIVGSELRYNFLDKINLGADLFFGGKRYSAGWDPTTNLLSSAVYEIDAYFDMSLHANYSFSDSFSVFLNANNILNNHYDIWYGFPSQGVNVLGGISYAF